MTPTTAQPPATGLRSIQDLPSPRGWPLLGNLLQVRPAYIHRDVEALARVHGPLFRLRLGPIRLLVVADHALVLGILRDRPDGFRRSPQLAQVSLEMGGSPGLFIAEGPAWQAQRRMVMAAFAPDQVRRYFPSLRTVAQRLQQRWQQAARSGATIALQADLKCFTVDAIAGLAFGTDVNSLQRGVDPIHRHLDTIFAGTYRRVMSPVPYWRWITLPADRRLATSLAALQAAVQSFISQARARLQADPARRAQPHNLLEAMLVAADQSGATVNEADVAGNVSTMLFAGEDTTANTLAWLIHLLHQHPEAQARARAEVLAEMPDLAQATPEQMDRLDWLDACITEAMRLKPVAPFLGLEALRDTRVADVAVPAGTQIWCVLRHDSVAPQHFANPGAFEPQRWAAGADKRVAMPFGAGARICPGRYLALLEIKLAMAMLLRHFDIEHVATPTGGTPREVMAFTMNPMPLQMRLRERVAAPAAPAGG